MKENVLCADNMHKKKRPYVAPRVIMESIEMEEGIAAGSTTVQPGSGNGVDVDPWIDGGSAGDGEPTTSWWQ